MGTDGFTLAGTEVEIPALGVGTWAWGDAKTWGYGTYDTAMSGDTITEAWSASIDAGATFFDTAEVYGGGESERIIGGLLADDPERAAKAIIATKFMPSPWKLQVTSALLGASSAEQIKENVGALKKLDFSAAELAEIDKHAVDLGINLWEKPSTDQRP
mgnify:CR=1 FL=1